MNLSPQAFSNVIATSQPNRNLSPQLRDRTILLKVHSPKAETVREAIAPSLTL